jgi:hypothetical protein
MHQYLTFSTEKPEKSALEVYLEHFGSYQKGLDLFVEDLSKSKMGLAAFVSLINQNQQPYLYESA